ncbi:unnamed protein product [Sphagnum troendelagicum]|uniref:Glycosyl transferase family 1 domain-containing protein n=1 Tax=Sphagnum troendelagicum TaxID=128251 RepID=A0ABP0THD9_9BRYO
MQFQCFSPLRKSSFDFKLGDQTAERFVGFTVSFIEVNWLFAAYQVRQDDTEQFKIIKWRSSKCRILWHLPSIVLKSWWEYYNGGEVWEARPFRHSLLWMAPFLSGGGYSSEAISYVTGLEAAKMVQKLQIRQHGDLESAVFWRGLPPDTKRTLLSLFHEDIHLSYSVVICHSEPGAWYPPLFQTSPCPPTGYEEPLFTIGRTMFETDRVNPDHVKRCNRMDEIWVPTQFHVEAFTHSGVEATKLVKVVQAVDTDFFNPANVKKLLLPRGQSLFHTKHPEDLKESRNKPFVFLSIFKWEVRKGWDILLRGYLQEFSGGDNVVLYVLTNRYHMTNKEFSSLIDGFVDSLEIPEPEGGWPAVYLVPRHIPQVDLPGLYKLADCFVLPSHGEGWGRPIVEAMAMELPVIVTNWSGMTEYMTDFNSYPLPLDGMTEVLDGPFKGHLWAEPSLAHLRLLMRKVFSNPREAKRRGKVARKDMVTKFSPEVVTRNILKQLMRLQKEIELRERRDDPAL